MFDVIIVFIQFLFVEHSVFFYRVPFSQWKLFNSFDFSWVCFLFLTVILFHFSSFRILYCALVTYTFRIYVKINSINAECVFSFVCACVVYVWWFLLISPIWSHFFCYSNGFCSIFEKMVLHWMNVNVSWKFLVRNYSFNVFNIIFFYFLIIWKVLHPTALFLQLKLTAGSAL